MEVNRFLWSRLGWVRFYRASSQFAREWLGVAIALVRPATAYSSNSATACRRAERFTGFDMWRVKPAASALS
jgi:hypothetical protein